MTGNEIIIWHYHYGGTSDNFPIYEPAFKHKVGEYDTIEDGYDDYSGPIHRLFYFKEHNVYIRQDGTFTSHYGADWKEPPYEVKKTVKTIESFERV